MSTQLGAQGVAQGACRQRDRSASTEKILQAGLETFAELGYDAATTKAIALRAGLSEAMLHRYFESKNGLLLAVLKSAHDALQCEKEYPAATTPAEEIFNFLVKKLEFDELNKKFMKVVISRMLVDPEINAVIRLFRPTPMDEVIGRRMLGFQERGLIRTDVPVPQCVEVIVAVGFEVGFLERSLFNRGTDSCRELFRIFSDNFARGLEPPRGPRARSDAERVA